jgi:hypothetical protein
MRKLKHRTYRCMGTELKVYRDRNYEKKVTENGVSRSIFGVIPVLLYEINGNLTISVEGCRYDSKNDREMYIWNVIERRP